MEPESYNIKSVRHLNSGRRGRQLCEVIFKDGIEVGKVRRTFIEKVKNQENLKDAGINLNQSPATRIRVDIMRILAARLCEEVPEGSAIVVPHVAKPVIILHGKNGKKRPLSYVTAIKSYGNLLTQSDKSRIADRMRRIGFTGSVERTFAILENDDSEEDGEDDGTRIPGLSSAPQGPTKKFFGNKPAPGKRSYAEMASSPTGSKVVKQMKH
jgi:hypothetical protein